MSKTVAGIDQIIDAIFQAHFSSIGQGVRPVQRKIVRSVLQGHNTLGLMPTGGGKSLCYWLAGKALNGISIVISPLTALMDEQAQKLAGHGCKVFTLHSGIDTRQQYKELIALYNNFEVPDFIFLSPERIATDGFLDFIFRSIRDKIKFIVIDEAHCISQWGLDFRPFYKEIPHFLNSVFNENWPALLCLTATLNPEDREQICTDFYIDPKHVIQSDMLLRPQITIKVVKVPDENTKDQYFWDLMEKHKLEKVLIYIDRKRGKRSVEEMSAQALSCGFKAIFFHGEMTVDEKSDVIRRFKSGELLTVFATNAFGMGIDIPDIRGVIHYLLPESTEQYYQQIGRVGRDGKPAWATVFYSDKNIDVRKTWFIEKSFPSEDNVQHAFNILTDGKIGKKTVNYFDEGDDTQSAYHYLVRSSVIQPICKGIQRLNVFKPAKSVSLPEFEKYINATRIGLLISIARKLDKPEPQILIDIYHWLAERKLQITHAPGKCLVVESFKDTLPEDLLSEIMADVAEKKKYSIGLFDEFVGMLEGYENSFQFHQVIGEYLGIDKFSRKRIHQTLSGDIVRSKSEVIIANILFQSNIPFRYEELLVAPDGTCYDPDFTIDWKGKRFFWEHLGMLDVESYEQDWSIKQKWYKKHFPSQLITTQETSTLSKEAEQIIAAHFSE